MLNLRLNIIMHGRNGNEMPLRGMVNRGKWRFQGYEIAWTDKPMS